jgi:hypothetical protein
VLLDMLQGYHHHVQVYENTLITKFFGLHRIKPYGGRKVAAGLKISPFFDLKFKIYL